MIFTKDVTIKIWILIFNRYQTILPAFVSPVFFHVLKRNEAVKKKTLLNIAIAHFFYAQLKPLIKKMTERWPVMFIFSFVIGDRC